MRKPFLQFGSAVSYRVGGWYGVAEVGVLMAIPIVGSIWAYPEWV